MSLHIKSKFTIKSCAFYLTNFSLNMNIWYLSRVKRVSIFNTYMTKNVNDNHGKPLIFFYKYILFLCCIYIL